MKLPNILNTTAAACLVAIPLTVSSSALADRSQALDTLAKLAKQDFQMNASDSDGADRIRMANRLTMLTQRVAAASCSLTSDVAIDESHFHLEEAMHEIDIIIDALKNGNEALHILGPEENAVTLKDIKLLDEEWQATHGAVESVLADGHDVDSAHIIDDHNLELLKLANNLLTDIQGQYSHPFEMTQADAMLLNISGRQRMLTQKMAKDACEIWTGYHAEEGRADLTETMANFETSLNALLNGMPSVGIAPAPNDAIRKDLESLLSRWSIIKGNLTKLLEGEELNYDQKFEIFHDFNIELEELDHLVHDYKLYVERHHS